MVTFLRAKPFSKDAMTLPVKDVEAALSFYESTMGFRVVSRSADPFPSAVLQRDDQCIAINENGGDPSQDGCFFEVTDVEALFTEFKANGLTSEANYRVDTYGDKQYKVFFVVAPDGLCFCLGQQLT